MFQPKVLSPTPDPWFARELRRIDPDLRVTWGYSRYFKHAWTIERKIPPERYFAMYASLLESDAPRFIEQPIFDTNQPEFDEFGEQTGFKVVGYREFDLAPEYEWVMFAERLGQPILTELKRAYAWERNHPISRIRFEKEQEELKKEEARRKQRLDVAIQALPDAFRATGKTLFGGQPDQVLDGTEL